MWTRRILAAITVFAAAGAAQAVDGVLEINQTCATLTGCFAGDAAGFPVQVTAAGASVRLTSDLTVPDENTTAIQVTADDVTIDLNGFAILGPVTCSGTPVSCSPSGSGFGIEANAVKGLSVSNGSIRGMGNDGILTGLHSHIQGVRARQNAGIGIWSGGSSLITGCVASENGVAGILADNGVVRDSVTIANAGRGIDSYGSTVLGNTMRSNGSYGLDSNNSTGYGNNQISGNNGGNANPQVNGASFEIAPNVCGGDLVCP